MNFTIKIWELIKGKEKIIDLKTFKTRHEALDFIEDYRAEQKPYKMKKGEKYSTTEM